MRAHPRPLPHHATLTFDAPASVLTNTALFNKWCSDKGTYWLSKHNYGAAYEPLLAPRRWSTYATQGPERADTSRTHSAPALG